MDRKVYRNKDDFDKKLELIALELDKHLFSSNGAARGSNVQAEEISK